MNRLRNSTAAIAIAIVLLVSPLSAQETESSQESLLKQCPPFAFVKRNHFDRPFGIGSMIGWDIYIPNCGIYTYDPARPEQLPKEIFKRADGTIFDMSVSFDANKLLFAFRSCPEKGAKFSAETAIPKVKHDPDERSFHIYEINVDGTGLRKITHGPYHDIHPFYLPGGKIGFVSTRVKAHTLCQPGAASALFAMNADGSGIKRIHFGTLADHSPFLMDDGRILFTRWEYQDKSLTYPQGLWTVNPDGTRVRLFYGNTIHEPAVTWQAREIPGSPEVICTLAPHHGRPVGAIGIIDRSKGVENPEAITNITPEIPYQPHLDRRRPGDKQYPWSYRDPYPIAKDRFLVAYGGGGPKRYRIYVLHRNGSKELVYEDEEISCFNPIPLVSRQKPHRKPELSESDSECGTFVVTDVYQGLLEHGIKRGDVKEIRVMLVEPKRCNMRGRRAYDMDPLVSRGTYYVKHCLGTVPVDGNGAAAFKAPAGVELYFQALDANGMELQRMGTVTQIMPGETQGCIGCHEAGFPAPPVGSGGRLSRKPVDITPPAWGAGPIDFVKHVQPVFDRHCTKCHGGVAPEKGLDLSGDKTRYFNMAYDNLTERRLMDYRWLLGASAKNWKPLTTGSRVSKLIAQMEKSPCNVQVDDESRRRLYTWIDANAPYYGTYEHTRPGRPGSRDAFEEEPWADEFNKVYSSKCLTCHGDLHKKNRGQRMTWINLTRPEFSRALNASLAREAGGLGLCKAMGDKKPPDFASKDDPTYQAMLTAIEAGKKALYATPRMDMPGGTPKPYPTDFGKLFSGFEGP